MKLPKKGNNFFVWLAKFIDNDGYIGLLKKRDLRMIRKFQWVPRVTITQKNNKVLHYIVDRIGFGRVHFHPYYRNKGNNGQSQAHFDHKQSKKILKKVMPYLQIKKGQAKILIKACELIQKKRTVNDEKKLEEFYLLLKKKHRGIKIKN